MPAGAMIAAAAGAMGSRRAAQQAMRRAGRNCRHLQRPSSPYEGPIFAIILLSIPTGIYLNGVHVQEPQYRAKKRREAEKKGITVEQFRNKELKEVEGMILPYTRFFARRYLEVECQKFARGQNVNE